MTESFYTEHYETALSYIIIFNVCTRCAYVDLNWLKRKIFSKGPFLVCFYRLSPRVHKNTSVMFVCTCLVFPN